MKTKLYLSSIIASISAVIFIANPVFAWHPVGYIQKQVQDITSNSAIVDANDINTALAVKSGDTLVYTFTVGNKGAVDESGNNDMAFVVLTDKLPDGVELVSDTNQRTIKLELGTIKPQASVTKTVTVKVVSTTDGADITNEACFTGNSTVNDNPQSGCDKAVVKVSVPVIPITPITPVIPVTHVTTPVKPITPVTSDKPLVISAVKTLPNTGPISMLPITLMVIVLGYGGSLFVKSKRA